MFKEKQAFALLRAQLEKKRERECQSCRKFRYLAYNYRTKKKREEKEKEKTLKQIQNVGN